MKKLEISQMENLQGENKCFEENVDSTAGIIGLGITAFGGPWCQAAYLAYIYAACQCLVLFKL